MERFIYTGTIRSFEIIVIVAFFLILLIGIIYVFFDLLRRENDEKGILLDNQIIEFEKKRYKKNEEMSNNASELKHNLKHILVAVKTELANNKIEITKKSIDDYLYVTNKIGVYSNFGSKVLDFLINKMISEAKDNNYLFKYTVNSRTDVVIRDSDYTILLGNALENAVIHSSDPKEISLNIQQRNEFIMFEVINTVNNSVDLSCIENVNQDFNHGYGLKSMMKIVEKNQGYIHFYVVNERFICTILIPLI